MQLIATLTLALLSALVLLTVVGSNLALGYQNGLTPANQGSWAPIVSAQLLLLTACMAFGNGPTHRRLVWFIAGCFVVLLTVVVSYSLLSTFPEPKRTIFLSELRANSLWVLIPPIGSSLLLLLVRPWFGELRLPSDLPSLQYSLFDVLAIMTLVGVGTAWFNYVANIRVEAANAGRIADIIPIAPLLYSALWSAPVIMSAIWVVFSERRRFIGLVALLVVLSLQLRHYSIVGIGSTVYSWSVFLASLVVLRHYGCQLLRRAEDATEARSQQEPA